MPCMIPERFSLMNRDYTVRHSTPAEDAAFNKMEEDGEGRLMGLCDFDEARVILAKHKNRESFEHTFFHELAHGLLTAIGRPELAEDEALVDAIGAALHQYEKTKSGRLPLRQKKENATVHTGKAAAKT